MAPDGYGRITVNWRGTRAHRVSWELRNGPLSPGAVVCHRCDNRACVNPDHLFVGTQADNMRDMVTKGRNARGEKCGPAKVTDRQAVEIRLLRKAGFPNRELAGAFGVSRNMIEKVTTGQTWKHLGGPRIPKAKGHLSADQVREIRRRLAAGEMKAPIAAAFNINRRSLLEIQKGNCHGRE